MARYLKQNTLFKKSLHFFVSFLKFNKENSDFNWNPVHYLTALYRHTFSTSLPKDETAGILGSFYKKLIDRRRKKEWFDISNKC